MKKYVIQEEDKFTHFFEYVRTRCCTKEFKPSKNAIKKNIKNKVYFAISPKSNDPDKKITNPKYKVRPGDIIFIPNKFFGIIDSSEKDEKSIAPKMKESDFIKLNIVHDDTDFSIVYKPRGILIHCKENEYSKIPIKEREETLVDALVRKYGVDGLSDLEGKFRSGIVHRIDRNTSGVIIVAKNNSVHEYFKNLFMFNHDMICRVYVCLVFNHFKNNNKGTIDKRIGRHSSNFMKRVVESEKTKGKSKTFKNAITHYKVVKEFSYKKKKFSLVHCRLETGRTHQIRVHMSSMGRSIVGDTLYGVKPKIQPFRRFNFVQIGIGEKKKKKFAQMLHARSIGFIHPSTEKYVEYTSDLPEYFESILKLINGDK